MIPTHATVRASLSQADGFSFQTYTVSSALEDHSMAWAPQQHAVSSGQKQSQFCLTVSPDAPTPSAGGPFGTSAIPLATPPVPMALPRAESKHEKASFLVCGTRFDIDAKYKLLKPIGQGAYGVVCSAENMLIRKHVAVKKITKAFSNLVETKRTLREVRLLRHFKHSNVHRLLLLCFHIGKQIIEILDIMKPDAYDKMDDIYIVSELMNTDLHQIIASSQPLTDEHVQYFVYQILRGLKYIHSANVLHRDLKPSNLLLNANCDLKICDFGLARVASPDFDQQGFLTEYVATRWYRAPEIMLSWKEYTKAIDVWSVGCILAEILGRKPLFPGKDYMHQLHLIIDILGTPSYEDTEFIANAKAKAYVRSLPAKKRVPFKKLFPKAPDAAIDLLERMLTFAPEKRITVDDALKHPYLKALHDPRDEPVCDRPFDFDIDADVEMTKDFLKAMLWLEACQFHGELRQLRLPPEALAAIDKSKRPRSREERKKDGGGGGGRIDVSSSASSRMDTSI